jgi:hypothetical protein
VGDTTVHPSNHIKYLGVILDKILQFDQHGKQISTQGKKALGSLFAIGNSTKSLNATIQMRLVDGLILPKISGALPACWYH